MFCSNITSKQPTPTKECQSVATTNRPEATQHVGSPKVQLDSLRKIGLEHASVKY